jgi:hypothetical protein
MMPYTPAVRGAQSCAAARAVPGTSSVSIARPRVAILALSALLCAPLVACAHDVVDATIPQDDTGALSDWVLPSVFDDLASLPLSTYDGSGQAVHPDVALFPDGWHGAHYWMTATPYPYGNAMYENPSLFTSDDGLTLTSAPGVSKPLIRALQYPDYNSDPDLVYDAQRDELVMSYRVVTGGKNVIYVTASSDGQNWSKPRIAFDEPNHSAVSQTIVPAYHAVPALAWAVDAGPDGCNSTATHVSIRRARNLDDPIERTRWMPPIATDMAVPGYLIWHLKVRYVVPKKEFWALIVAYPNDGRSCGSDDLFLAHSKDGVHWETYPQSLLRHEDREWTSGALYRGTFLYDAQRDQLALWFSARDDQNEWHLGFVRMDYAPLLARLSSLSAARNSIGKAPRPIWTDAP